MMTRLEEELAEEKERRAYLEKLRLQLMALIGKGYIEGVEEQIRRGSGDFSMLPTMFNKGPGADEETQWDEDDQKLALELWNEGKEVKDPKKKKVGGKLKKAMLASGAATALNMRHLLWSVQDLYENKIKRDGVDELEHRPKQKLDAFISDFYYNKHGTAQPSTAQQARQLLTSLSLPLCHSTQA